jgi:glycerol uptake facilitator-like aquaporin
MLRRFVSQFSPSRPVWRSWKHGSDPAAGGWRRPMVYECLILKIILTFILMFVILNVATGGKEKGIFTGIVVGGLIALEAIFAGPISGASMNPARSLGPAFASGNFTAFWIYLIGPIIGSLFAVPIWRYISASKDNPPKA